jgi:pimeloyl-ACP methyl ester carboxylesterase
MSKPTVVARVLEGDRLECQVTPEHGEQLTLTGKTTDVEPTVESSSPLQEYQAIVDNAWAFAKFTYLKVHLPSHEEQKVAAKNAKAHRSVTEWMVGLADEPATVTRQGWCSSCFSHGKHQKVKLPTAQLPAYLCCSCGTPTLPCAAKDCDHMAVRKRGPVRMPRFCAEHRHEIPGFEKASDRLDSLTRYEEIFEYEQPNLAKASKLVGVGATALAVGVTGGLAAAPAVGGAVGTALSTYSGAAATSYGLALLGGGSVAAGGLGMAGGTIVVAAVGGALGGAMGASVMNAYVREDDSFHIELLQGGRGTPVIVCNGFLSEKGKGWGEWHDIVNKRYPDSPVYRVHWGAKELRSLGSLASFSAVKTASTSQIQHAAAAATKAGAKKLGPLAPVLVLAGLAKNPWHVARSRADKTGVIVADLLARTTVDSYVLIGHSLGARAMAVAAQTLGTDPKDRAANAVHQSDAPRIEAVHLLGAAIGHKSDAETLTARVDDAVYNYHSENDNVLKYLYGAAQAGHAAAGRHGFASSAEKLKNIDVSADVECHSDYHGNIELR